MAADMTGTQDLFVAKHIRWVQAVFCSFFFCHYVRFMFWYKGILGTF